MSGIEPCQTKVETRHRAERLRFAVAAVSLVAGIAALPSETMAQQWLFTPVVEIGVQHIDNPRLIEGDVDTDNITGGMVDVAAEMRRNTQISSILFRPAAAIYRYSGDSDEDSESYFMDFDANRTGQRSQWRFTANFSQQQVFRGETTSSEIDDPGVDDSDQTGTGRTFERRERDLWRVRPGATFNFTERTALKLDFNYLNAQYDTQEVGEAVDYWNGRADASIVRALTPDSDLEFGVFASRYDPDRLNGETDSTGVRARYQKEVSDISTFFIEVGAQNSDVPSVVNPGTESSESSFLWSMGYARQLQRTRWRFDIGQAVTPSGSGVLVERDQFRVSMQHQLRPRWALMLSAVALNTGGVAEEDIVTTNDRDYLQGRVALAYEMSLNWTVEGLYGLTYQDFADIEGDAQEHEVRLSLIYRPPLPTR